MFCAVSGSVPEAPVVSIKSGHVFEKSIAEKYVRETGKCPVTGEAMALDDLLPLKANKTVKPRTSQATSVPGLLGLFHDEWDALMLEAHTLRQNLHTVRQELSHALYQHDAACRVIARLIRERDESRAALENIREQVKAELASAAAAASKRGAEQEEEEQPGAKRARMAGIPPEVLDELTEVNASLSKGRKKRAISASLASAEEIGSLAQLGSYPLHQTKKPGINFIDVSPASDAIVATAGADSNVQVYDLGQQRVVASLTGHTKRVNAVQFAEPSVLLTASADKTAGVWRLGDDGSAQCAALLRDHTADVTGITLHPSRKYFVTASADKSWCFCDLATGQALVQVQDEQVAAGYTTAQFHPDGLILGTGTEDRMVRIWELKAQKNVASFSDVGGPVRSIAFSENGYYLATAAAEGVKVYDLRKLKVVKAFEPYSNGCSAVAFDHSGVYLAAGGAGVTVYGTKADWAVVKEFPDVHKKGVTALRWGADAKSLLVGSGDHNLRVFGLGA